MAGKGGRPKNGSAISKQYSDETLHQSVNDTPKQILDGEEDKESIRDAIKDMLTGNLNNLPLWLEEIGKEDPLKALTIFKDFAEYVLPKKQREDGKGDNIAPVIINFSPTSKMPEDVSKVKPQEQEEFVKNEKMIIQRKKNNILDELIRDDK